ncbi:ABC transporter substrate-binding protein [Glycomyces buryatensis]|nr:ABC transporter substrate-binding protein [Glycomyces buryatensis]
MALTRRALGGITIGGSAALTLAACGGNEGGSGNGAGKEEITWAVASGWASWNLNTSTGSNSYLQQASTPMNPSGQTGGDFDGNAEYHYDDALFASEPELVSEEPMTVKYVLNEKAQWSDGNPVRVEDFIFHWYSVSGNEDHADQEKALPASTNWGPNVADIVQQDDGSIHVVYIDGYSDPEWLFSPCLYLPSHLADANGFEGWQDDPAVMGEAIAWFEETPPTVGTGPYKPVDAKMGEHIIYEINENYQGSIKPTIKKVTMKVVEGTEAIVTAIRNGEIDGAWPSEFSEEENSKIAEDPAIKTEVYPGSIWLHIDCNTKGLLSDVELRKAVFTAIDSADIVAKNYPESGLEPKGNHFFANASEYYVDYVTPTGQGTGDIAAATAILEAAGYTGIGDALMTPEGEAVKLTFRYGEGDATRTTAGELTQAYLAELGIEVELKSIADGDLGPVLAGADFDLIIFGWSGNAAFTLAPNQYFLSTSESNYGKYESAAADEAIAKVRSTFDIAEAAEFTNAVDEIVVPDAYTLPLFDEPQTYYAVSTVLEGPGANGYSQSGPIWNIREWKTI